MSFFKNSKICYGFVFFVLAACGAPSNAPPRTVDDLDLERYVGKWYEFASFPNRFQKGCVGSTATYRLEDSYMMVVNECFDRSFGGKKRRVEGKAWVAENSGFSSKLKVRFFWPFVGHYWVIGLDENYKWALVGDPKRKYLWILSRSPFLQPEIYEEILILANKQGYETSKLQITLQKK